MGSGLSLSEEHVAALLALDGAELLARQLDDKKLLRRILRFEAASACETADYIRGRDAALEALQPWEVLNDKTAYVAILQNELANNESALGNLDSATRHLHAVDQIAQEHGNAKLQAMAVEIVRTHRDELQRKPGITLRTNTKCSGLRASARPRP